MAHNISSNLLFPKVTHLRIAQTMHIWVAMIWTLRFPFRIWDTSLMFLSKTLLQMRGQHWILCFKCNQFYNTLKDWANCRFVSVKIKDIFTSNSAATFREFNQEEFPFSFKPLSTNSANLVVSFSAHSFSEESNAVVEKLFFKKVRKLLTHYCFDLGNPSSETFSQNICITCRACFLIFLNWWQTLHTVLITPVFVYGCCIKLTTYKCILNLNGPFRNLEHMTIGNEHDYSSIFHHESTS